MKKVFFLFLLVGFIFSSSDLFITEWQTTEANEVITLPIFMGGNYDFNVNWGDGSPVQTITSYSQREHTYSTSGVYTITINGVINGWNFQITPHSATKIMEINQWGTLKISNTQGVFRGTTNLMTITATDTPDLTGITTLNSLFRESGIVSINKINNWNVSNVIDMRGMFSGATSFNGNISNWNVSNVEDMGGMFYYAMSFNQPLDEWDVSSVTDMEVMFAGATNFNQPLDKWDVSNVTNMYGMFYYAMSFNQPLGEWDVSSVTNMEYMFEGITLSGENYDNLLIGWESKGVQNGVTFHGGNSQYCLGAGAKKNLEEYWYIYDGDRNCDGVYLAAPIITVISPEEGETYDTQDILVNISVEGDYIEEIWYNTNGIGDNITYEIPNLITFNKGENILHVWANNIVGNESYTNVTFTLNIPEIFEIIINSPLNQTYDSNGITIDIESNKYGDIWYNWNGTTVNYTGKTDVVFPSGTHILTAWGESNSNETDYKNVTFTVDVPEEFKVIIISPISKEIYYTNTIPLNISTSGGEADTIWYSLDGGVTNETYTIPTDMNLDNGYYVLDVWANDTKGDISQDSIGFTVDVFDDFEITINSPLNITYNYNEITIDITSNHEGNIWYDWNGTTMFYTGKTDISFPDGTHTLEVWGESNSNETDYKTVVFTIKEDEIPVDTYLIPLATFSAGVGAYILYRRMRGARGQIMWW